MKKEYDFSNSKKNPYTEQLNRPITIRLQQDVIDYFKKLADETDIPYQKLIKLYLADCMQSNRKLNMKWAS